MVMTQSRLAEALGIPKCDVCHALRGVEPLCKRPQIYDPEEARQAILAWYKRREEKLTDRMAELSGRIRRVETTEFGGGGHG